MMENIYKEILKIAQANPRGLSRAKIVTHS